MKSLNHLRFIGRSYKHLPGKHNQQKHGSDGGGGSGSGSASGSVARFQATSAEFQQAIDNAKQQVSVITERMIARHATPIPDAKQYWLDTQADDAMLQDVIKAQKPAIQEAYKKQSAAISQMSDDEQNAVYRQIQKPFANENDFALAVNLSLYGNPDLRMQITQDINKNEYDSKVTQISTTGLSGAIVPIANMKQVHEYLSLERRLRFASVPITKSEEQIQADFIREFTKLHTSQRTDNLAGAMIQHTMAQVGPNAGKDLSNLFWPDGVKPPRPNPEIVRRLQMQYEQTQQRFRDGEYDYGDNVEEQNGRYYVGMYRGEKLSGNEPMQPWSTNEVVAARFSRESYSSPAGLMRDAYIPQEYIFIGSEDPNWVTDFGYEREYLVLGAFTSDYKPVDTRTDDVAGIEIIRQVYEISKDELARGKREKQFDGLINRLKHLPGKHNQGSHGRKRGGSAGGVSADDDSVQIEARRRNYNVDPDMQLDMFGNAITPTPESTPDTATPGPITPDTATPTAKRVARFNSADEAIIAAGIDLSDPLVAEVYSRNKEQLERLLTDVNAFAQEAQQFRDDAYQALELDSITLPNGTIVTPIRDTPNNQQIRNQVYDGLAQRGNDIAQRLQTEMVNAILPYSWENNDEYDAAIKRRDALIAEFDAWRASVPFGTEVSDWPKYAEMNASLDEPQRADERRIRKYQIAQQLTRAVAREAFRSSEPAKTPELPKIKSSEPIDNPAKAQKPVYSADIRDIEAGYALLREYAYIHPGANATRYVITEATADYSNRYLGAVITPSSMDSYGKRTFGSEMIFQVTPAGIREARDETKTTHAVSVHEATHVLDTIKMGQFDRIAQTYAEFGDSTVTATRNSEKKPGDNVMILKQANVKVPYPYMKQVYYGITQESIPNNPLPRTPTDTIIASEFNTVMSEMILGNYTGISLPEPYKNTRAVGRWYANLHW